ncbi:hypothetical protein DFJ77DRAFT_479920 [Powellomyces hirtus]|nr:hypothetical protein DFJ77DRAFT_479920 [Powellomyces hirtus]
MPMRRSDRYRVSYALRENYGSQQLHCAGINSLALDETTPTEADGQPGGILYTAGRDSVINSWECHMDFARHQSIVEERERDRELGLERDRWDTYPTTPLGFGGSPELSMSSLSRPNAARRTTSNRLSTSNTSLRPPVHELTDENLSRRLSVNDSPSGEARDAPRFGDVMLSSSPPESPHHSQGSLQNGDVHRSDMRHPDALHASYRSASGHFRETLASTGRSLSGPKQLPSGVSFRRSESIMSVDRSSRFNRNSRIRPGPSTLRCSYQHHSDWVNDVVLLNDNQHILSASNDRTICLTRADKCCNPTQIGTHSDYVKCLAYSRHANWVASGGLDHRIFLWDVGQGKGQISAMNSNYRPHDLRDDKLPKASIYSLACNPSGSVLVSGSPDKSVRVWDHRSKTCVMRLQGHGDNIRSLLVSDDGRRVLSASCDSTVKLWSLAKPHRPMHTYSHFEDSVYCLYSTHPDLDTFWTGGRDGWVTKVSMSKTVDTSDDLLEVVAICKEDSPVHKIVAINDMYLWTATANSTVNRWRDIPFQHVDFVEPNRVYDAHDDQSRVLIPRNSMLTIPNVKSLDEASTTQSFRPFSVIDKTYGGNKNKDTSVFGLSGDFLGADADDQPSVEPAWREPDGRIVGVPGVTKCVILNNRRHVVTENTVGEVALWDIIRCVKLKSAKGNFSKMVDEHNTMDWIANWCSVDIHKGFLVVHLDESNCYDGEIYPDECGIPDVPYADDTRINLGKWVLTLLFKKYTDALHAPDDSLQRHDQREEADDEDDDDEDEEEEHSHLPLRGAAGLNGRSPNELSSAIASPMIQEAGGVDYFPTQSMTRMAMSNGNVSSAPSEPNVESVGSSNGSQSSAEGGPRETGETPAHESTVSEQGAEETAPPAGDIVFAIPPPPVSTPPPEAFSAASSMSSLYPLRVEAWNETSNEPEGGPLVKYPTEESTSTAETPAESAGAGFDSLSSTPPASRPGSPSLERTSTFMDKLRSQVRRRASSARSDELLGEPSTGRKDRKDKEKDRPRLSRSESKGRILTFLEGNGLLKSSDKEGKREDDAPSLKSLDAPAPASAPAPAPPPAHVTAPSPAPTTAPSPTPIPKPLPATDLMSTPVPSRAADNSNDSHQPKRLGQAVSYEPNNAPPRPSRSERSAATRRYIDESETPILKVPPTLPVIISKEENQDDAAFLDVYQGITGHMGLPEEVDRLGHHLPAWIVGPIVQRKSVAPRENAKMQFAIDHVSAPPGGNSPTSIRLSTNKNLRLTKLMVYILDKVDPEPIAADKKKAKEKGITKPDDFLEVLCHDKVVHPHMTLGAIKHHLWKNSGELSLQYRAKANF